MDLVFSETGLQGANLKRMDTRSAEKTEWWDRLSHFFWENSVTGTVSEVPVHQDVQHREQTGGTGGACEVTELQPHWGDRNVTG